MALATGNILRVAAKCEYAGTDDVINVFHLQVVANPSPNDDVSALEDISEIVADAYSNIASELNAGIEPVVIDVYNVTQDRPIGSTSWDAAFTGGVASGEMMPLDDACLVLLGTGVKRRQGRMYFSGFTEANQSAGHWSAGLRSACAALPGVMLLPFGTSNGGDFVLVVWSRVDGIAYPIYTIRAQELVADMPSRKPGRGS